ncbi:MAG: helix-turn-helix domain-containing protein [Acidimicrobiia bacterium]
MRRFSEEAEKALIWERRSQGVGMRSVARELGRAHGSVRTMVEDRGGVRPRRRVRAGWHLSYREREEISRGAAGESLRSIAVRLGRSASTVSREVAPNGGRSGYRAHRADLAAQYGRP